MAEQKNIEHEKNKLAPIDRFTNSIMKCYGDQENGISITEREKDCIKSYFQVIDRTLRDSDKGYNWNMVRMDKLAPALYHYARIGLDMNIPNHLSPVPYMERETGKVNMTLIVGYAGEMYKAMKFAVNRPKNIIAHLIGKNDRFTALRKDANHPYETYIFEENSLDKGECIGAFCYVEYDDESLNSLTVMNIEEIMNHKPDRASEKFWGGKWKGKMQLKTVIKEACKKIPMDAEKIRDYKQDLAQFDADSLNFTAVESNAIADEKTGTGDIIDIEDYEEVSEGYTPVADQETGEVKLEV